MIKELVIEYFTHEKIIQYKGYTINGLRDGIWIHYHYNIANTIADLTYYKMGEQIPKLTYFHMNKIIHYYIA
jgi:hypothetical protein